MTETASQCTCIVDTDGLHGIAKASGNQKGILLDFLKSGVIGVPVCAWQEFGKLYEDEAASLEPFVTTRIIMKRAYYIAAARSADRLNSGFPRGSYDDNVELITASIALSNGYRILTSSAQTTIYEGMQCDVSDLDEWVEQLGD
jgi:hypothetical protein